MSVIVWDNNKLIIMTEIILRPTYVSLKTLFSIDIIYQFYHGLVLIIISESRSHGYIILIRRPWFHTSSRFSLFLLFKFVYQKILLFMASLNVLQLWRKIFAKKTSKGYPVIRPCAVSQISSNYLNISTVAPCVQVQYIFWWVFPLLFTVKGGYLRYRRGPTEGNYIIQH